MASSQVAVEVHGQKHNQQLSLGHPPSLHYTHTVLRSRQHACTHDIDHCHCGVGGIPGSALEPSVHASPLQRSPSMSPDPVGAGLLLSERVLLEAERSPRHRRQNGYSLERIVLNTGTLLRPYPTDNNFERLRRKHALYDQRHRCPAVPV